MMFGFAIDDFLCVVEFMLSIIMCRLGVNVRVGGRIDWVMISVVGNGV